MFSRAHGTVTMGTDPEFFFVHNDTGEVVPADKFLPSVKTPKVLHSGITAHFDGLQGEFTIKESFCKGLLLGRVNEAMVWGGRLAAEHNTSLDVSSSKAITKEILASSLPEARIFGCDVDYISWLGGRPNPIRVDPLTHLTRYAGGHIHLGYVNTKGDDDYKNYKHLYKTDDSIDRVKELLTSKDGVILVVKAMDYLVGNTMVLLDQSPESKVRREIYGKAGVFRNPAHGVEYRVLSNFFLKAPQIMDLVLTCSREVIGQFLVNGLDDLLAAVSPEDIIVAINTNDKELAFRNWTAIKNSIRFTEPHLDPSGIHALEYLATTGIDKVFTATPVNSWRYEREHNSLFSAVVYTPEYKQYIKELPAKSN